uniref:Uncharacterized protein n=1 Tax=Arundo donax TaxID=35708 RepID=A0A0A9B2C8_ARUDO
MDLLQTARQRYQNRVPGNCFFAKVPEWLRHTPDHVIAPSHYLNTEEGFKWVKASRYEAFVQACRTYWHDNVSGPPLILGKISSDAAEHSQLRVLVMPYMPLDDAYKLHQLIMEPDLLPITFAEKLESLKQKSDNEADGENLGLAQLLHENDDEEEEEGVGIEWDLKEGCVPVRDSGDSVKFVVANYTILWAKAEKHCLFRFMADPFQGILAHLRKVEKLLYNPSANMLQNLQEDVEQSRRELIFAMYQAGIDPHDVILSLYHNIHAAVYQEGRVHCDPEIPYVDEEDTPETMERLAAALTHLGFQQYNANLSVEEAQGNLMSAQGHLDAYMCQFNAMQTFTNARETFRLAMNPVLHELRLASHIPTVMGVASMENDKA